MEMINKKVEKKGGFGAVGVGVIRKIIIKRKKNGKTGKSGEHMICSSLGCVWCWGGAFYSICVFMCAGISLEKCFGDFKNKNAQWSNILAKRWELGSFVKSIIVNERRARIKSRFVGLFVGNLLIIIAISVMVLCTCVCFVAFVVVVVVDYCFV